ncbi:MAG: heavy metal-associated domain-containing protein, partial [Armatimonadota bacterium]|nr:heavy metal-associated domain-containing protein [Armatimonadota bacterium]
MTEPSTAELSVRGMDCADCARHVQRALSGVPGVKEVEV